MVRKKSQGAADILVEQFSRLHWRYGVMAAGVAYLLLHWLATPTAPAAVLPGQAAGVASKILLHTLAGIGQYLVPALLLLGSLISLIKQGQRSELVERTHTDDPATAIRQMRWTEFEIFVGEAFRQKGYTVNETGGGGSDGGVDLKLTRGRETFLVQCKHWKAMQVGVSVVRELYGVMASEGVTGGFVVTSGKCSPDAHAFTKGKNLVLIEGDELADMLGHARLILKPMATVAPATNCPLCQSAMVKRMTKRGANAGNYFWGCSRFPDCKGTRPI